MTSPLNLLTAPVRIARQAEGLLGIRKGVTVQRLIPAEAGLIFDLLADPSRHQEIDGSGTVREAIEGSSRLALGSRFGMGMKIGVAYDMINEIVEFEEDRRIAWQARPSKAFARAFIGGRIWRYELEPVVGGTVVRETWDVSGEVLPLLIQSARGMTRTNMAKTLARIEAIVTKPAVAQPAAVKPAVVKPAKSAVAKAAVAKAVVTKPVVTKPVVTKPEVTQPVVPQNPEV